MKVYLYQKLYVLLFFYRFISNLYLFLFFIWIITNNFIKFVTETDQRGIKFTTGNEKTLFQKIHFTGRDVLRCFCKQFNEKSTISISSWSPLQKGKRLPCHGPVLLPFRLFSWIHICEWTRLPEDKPGKKYCRSDNTMFAQRNLNWRDKIFCNFTFMKRTCCRSENVSIHFHSFIISRKIHSKIMRILIRRNLFKNKILGIWYNFFQRN